MKRSIKFILILTLIFAICLSFCGCKNSDSNKDIWESATYTEDTQFGDGEKTIMLEVVAEDKSVTFTIKTDKKTLGEALVEHELISGEQGAYGLYIKAVNGMTADYDKDQSYWAVTKAGGSLMTGVDGVDISDGEHFEMIYNK